MATVTGEIERLEQTTQHYLTLATRPAAALVPTDPKVLLDSVRRLLEAELRVAQVDLSLRVLAGDPVDLDANQLRRALLNVVKNAVEAGAKQIEISVERRQGALRLVYRAPFSPCVTLRRNTVPLSLSLARTRRRTRSH